MNHHHEVHPDYGTGQKKLSIYIFGMVGCVLLTIFAFWVVMSSAFTALQSFALIFSAACIQFLVQVLCFLRLNTETNQGIVNVLCLIFTVIILLTIVAGSLWIMHNLHHYMGMH